MPEPRRAIARTDSTQPHVEARLGRLIDDQQGRDAVHIALAPVQAGKLLLPGQHVAIAPDTVDVVIPSTKPIGIIDPYLLEAVKEGERCWLCLYPGSVTSLRHAWTHPAFAEVDKVAEDLQKSEIWLRMYAARLNSYDEPENAYARLCEDLREGSISAYGTDLYSVDDLNNSTELKEHAEKVLGISINWNEFSFRCSC